MLELKPNEIECWLTHVHSKFIEVAPDLLPVFDTYSSEAIFGRRYIENDINSLHSGAQILEIGAGSLLLSCQLVREGFKVTAIEPTGIGFSHLHRVSQIVLEEARNMDCCPELFFLPAESFSQIDQFDYAFSINVMEHVENVEITLQNIGRSLKENAIYRFTCPNYCFPYEPHFNIPTLISKRLSEFMLRSIIFNSQRVVAPEGTWKSLNWINVFQIGRFARRHKWLQISFDQSIIVTTLERILSEKDFAARRSSFMCRFVTGVVHCRIHRLLRLVPVFLLPIIDCSMRKIRNEKGGHK